MNLIPPVQDTNVLESALLKQLATRLTGPWREFVSNLTRRTNEMSGVGTTAQRPTTGLYVGYGPYWDTSLGKPVWVAVVGPPAVWHDGAGAVS